MTDLADINPQFNTLKLLTYNIGLLKATLCGIPILENPPYAAQRLPLIPNALRALDADIVSLQECYEDAHAEFVHQALIDIYPHMASGGGLKFHNGLVILSRYPIKSSYLQPLNQVATLEKYMASKSNLIAVIATPFGDVTCVNMHTTAGGTDHPEAPPVNAMRQDELQQAMDAIKSSNNDIGIIIGDLNCGPEASLENYQFPLSHNYRDMFNEGCAAMGITTEDKFTWDPKNYLNASGVHSHCPGQRCDHIMLTTTNPSTVIKATKAAIVLEECDVPIRDGVKSTLSDHYGVLVEIVKE